jgi:Ca2+-binding RTX toxin-like protein
MAFLREGFEDVPITSNSPRIFPGFINVGWQSDFTFASGVKLIEPVPNTSETPVLVGDFDLDAGNPTWNLGTNGIVDASDVDPSGSAYIARQSSNGRIGFAFTGEVYRVGAYADGYNSGGVSIAAYDSAGRLISGAQARNVAVTDWDDNFVQVMSKVPIAKVVFTGSYPVLEDLSFITSKPHIINGTQRDDILDGTNPGRKSDGADFILGKGGVDKISGLGGPDTLDGANRDDTLKGGDGDDTLIGGNGNDKLFGGAGQDTFIFRRPDYIDKLKDFDPVDDTIMLVHGAKGGLPLGSLNESLFRTGLPDQGPEKIIYDPNSGKLFFDGDGAGGDAAVQFAKLAKNLAMTAADFTVV